MSNQPKKVNIPRSVEDSHYRYQMEEIVSKVQGRGIGIHTKIPNIAQISQDLHREQTDIMKFFSFELAAQIRGGDIINGQFSQQDLATTLDLFISKFVLCGSCGNPETLIQPSKGGVELRCISCGRPTRCDPKHRLTEFILKDSAKRRAQAKQAYIEAQKAAKKKQKTKGKKSKKSRSKKRSTDGNDDDEVEWVADVSSTAVKERRRAALGGKGAKAPEKDDPETVFAEMVASEDVPTAEQLKDLRDDLRLSPEELSTKICGVVLSRDGIAKQIVPVCKKWGSFFAQPRYQKGLMRFLCSISTGEEQEDFRGKLPAVVKGFYDRDCLEEEVILEWYEEAEDTVLDVKLALAPLIQWLKDAESEESSE